MHRILYKDDCFNHDILSDVTWVPDIVAKEEFPDVLAKQDNVLMLFGLKEKRSKNDIVFDFTSFTRDQIGKSLEIIGCIVYDTGDTSPLPIIRAII